MKIGKFLREVSIVCKNVLNSRRDYLKRVSFKTKKNPEKIKSSGIIS